MENQYAKQRIVKDIKNDDIKIQITGYVNEIKNDNTIILKDDTGEITIDLKEVDLNFKKDDLVNIIGELRITTTGEKVLDAQIIQDMKKLNFKYYKKLYELKKEILEN